MTNQSVNPLPMCLDLKLRDLLVLCFFHLEIIAANPPVSGTHWTSLGNTYSQKK